MMTKQEIRRAVREMTIKLDDRAKQDLLDRAHEIWVGDWLKVLIETIESELTMDDGFFDEGDRIECDW